MAFAVEDFEDFLAILRVHAEWQAELRRILVDDELANLRRAVEEGRLALDAAIARLAAQIEEMSKQFEARFGAAETRADRVETRLGGIDHRLDRVETRLGGIDNRLDRIEVDVGDLKGRANETWYRERAAGIFGHVLRRVRAISFADLDEVRSAQANGAITSDERRDLRSLDLLVQGLDDNGQMQAIALEVAWKLDEADVSTAARRADVIARSGVPCTAAIGGHEGHDDVLLAARRAGVAVLREGDIVYWPEVA